MIEKKMIRHIVDMLMIMVLPLLMAFEPVSYTHLTLPTKA